MKHLRSTFFIVVALLVMLAACAPQSTPAVVVVTATTEVQAAVPSDTPTTASTAEAPPAATATLEPINLLPPMKVGSTFRYVDGSTLVAVPNEGPVTVGKKGGTDNPQTQITLSDFWIYRTKVTNMEYALCVAAGQCTPPDLNDNQGYNDAYRVNDPVVGVTWDQANAYCTFVHGHLPTEWQWEKTGRGPDANLYAWGSGQPSCDLLNFNNCVGKTTDVNTYPQGKSYYDAFDMSGNAFEWTGNRYDALYYRTMPTQDPPGPDTGATRSVRSTSYKSSTDQTTLYVRFFDNPRNHRRDLGFRCVVDDPGFFAPACETIAYVGLNAPGGGPGPAAIPTPDCNPDVGVTSSGYCGAGDVPAANLDFSNPGGATLAAGMPDVPAGCTENPPGSGHYDCFGAANAILGTARIQRVCTVPLPPVPAGCGAGYTETPPGSHHCEWTGGSTAATECLSGTTYDPVNQCCTSTPGVGSSFNLCPADAPYYAGGICVPWPTSDNGPMHTAQVQIGSCSPHGSTGDIDSSPLYAALTTATDETPRPPVAPISGILTLGVLGAVVWINYHGRRRS